MERLIQQAVSDAFPSHGFLGEESVEAGAKASAAALNAAMDASGSEWLWICDPIDGTTNFVQVRRAQAGHVGLSIASWISTLRMIGDGLDRGKQWHVRIRPSFPTALPFPLLPHRPHPPPSPLPHPQSLPLVGVSIGVARRTPSGDWRMECGVIVDPLRGGAPDVFSAIAGGGAFLNGAPISVGSECLADAVVATGEPR